MYAITHDVPQKSLSYATSLAPTSKLIRPAEAVALLQKRGNEKHFKLGSLASSNNHRCRPTLSDDFILPCLEGNLNVAVVVDVETEV